MTSQIRQNTKKGQASDRIVFALASLAPFKPSRKQLLDSGNLSEQHSKASLSGEEERNAAKTLGRMVSGGVLHEVLVPDGAKLELPELGLIAVTVNLYVLNKMYDEWKKVETNDQKPSQETIMKTIRDSTIIWSTDNLLDGKLPMYINDIYIVHGSNMFDILISVFYKDTQTFTTYIRDVIQRVRGVKGTQTMQISKSPSELWTDLQ